MIILNVQLLLKTSNFQQKFTSHARKSESIAHTGFPGGAVVRHPPANAGARVQTLGRKDPTYRGATKPVCHNY